MSAPTDGDEGRLPVRAYRQLIRDRLVREDILDESDSARMELVFNLSRLLNRLGQDFETVHRRHGWTWAGFRIMNVLWVAGPVELREVARLSGSSRASISSALNTLERDGLVTRRRNGTDRRQVLLELTERGRSELRGGMRDQADLEREWFGPLSAQDQEVLTRLLGALADQVRPTKTKPRSSKAW